jgi:hypothetical protein
MHTSIVRCAVHIARSLPLLALAGALAAQDSPPAYLQIFREEVKPGRGGPHVTTEAGWPRAFARAKTPNYYLAMTTIYGPSEAWFVEGHGSVAEIEEANKAIDAAPGLNAELDRLAQADAANVSGVRGILGRYRADLSSGGAVDVSQMRVWEVLVFQVRPGHEANFGEAAKLYKSTVEQAKVDLPWATYEVLAGMPGPTYLIFVPHRTLTEIDPAAGVGAAVEKAFSEEAMKKLSTLAEGYSSVEDMIFTVSPQMSYLSSEFVARDPKFWTRKSPAAKRQPPASKPQQ